MTKGILIEICSTSYSEISMVLIMHPVANLMFSGDFFMHPIVCNNYLQHLHVPSLIKHITIISCCNYLCSFQEIFMALNYTPLCMEGGK